MDFDWAPTIAAVLGSTGLIGLITALITRTRVSRLRRFVDEAKAVKETLPERSKAQAVLDQAIDQATLRLASVELTRFGASTRVAIAVWAAIVIPAFGVIGFLAWASGMSAVQGLSEGNGAAVAGGLSNLYVSIIYIILGVAGAVYLVQWRREKIMRPALIRLPTALITPEIRRTRRAHVEDLRLRRKRHDKKWNSVRYRRRFAKRLAELRAERRRGSSTSDATASGVSDPST